MNRNTLVSMMVGAGIASAGSMAPQQAKADFGNLDVKGMMRTEIAVSLDGKGNPNNQRALDSSDSSINMFAARMELDFSWRKNDNWSGFAKVRGWADFTTLIDQGYDDDNADLFAGATFGGDHELLEQSGKYHILDMAVAYVDYTNGPLWLRVGKQQIAWGESFGFRTLDMVNSLDLRRHLVFDVQAEEFSDERIATLGIRGSYSPPAWNGWEMEGFMTSFTPTLFAPQGSPYSNIHSGVTLNDADSIENARKKIVYGGRLRGPLGNTGIEVQMNFVSRPQQTGVFEFAAGDLQDPGKFNGNGIIARDTGAINGVTNIGTSNIPTGSGFIGLFDDLDGAGAGAAAGRTVFAVGQTSDQTYGAPLGSDGTPLVAPSYNPDTDITSLDALGSVNFGASIINIGQANGDFNAAAVAAAGGGLASRNFAHANASAASILRYEQEQAAFNTELQKMKDIAGPAPFSASGDGLFYALVGKAGDENPRGLGLTKDMIFNTDFVPGLDPDLVSRKRGFQTETQVQVANAAGQIDDTEFRRVISSEWGSPTVDGALDYSNCTGQTHQGAVDSGLGADFYDRGENAAPIFHTDSSGNPISCDQLKGAHGTFLAAGQSGINAFLALIESTGDITRKFPRVNIIGTGFNYMFQVPPSSPFNFVFDGLLLKGEASWAFNKQFTNNLSRKHVKQDEQNWSFLLEKYQKWTYDFPATYLVLQFNHRSESNGFDQLTKNIGNNGYNLIAFGAQQQWMQNKLRIDFAGAYDMNSGGGGWFTQPGIRYKPYEQMQFDLYWNHFEGNNDNTFGAIERNDEVFTRVSRFF